MLVEYAETAEVAGNIFDRVCAQGIDVHGAKQNGAATDRPFARILIHHNKVVDSLLNTDDFGGIETWQGGPAYVYDNISGNPGGYRNWDHVLNPNTESRFGHAYYLDGAFKNYYFNNIAWGKSKGPAGKLANTSAFQEIISYQNTFFNNTIYNFVRGSRRQEPQAGRRQVPGQRLAEHGPARLPRCRSGADRGRRQRGRRRTPSQPVRHRHRRLRPQRLLRLGARVSACSSLPGGGTRRSRRFGKPWKATNRWPRPWASWRSSRPCAIRPLTTSGPPPTRRPAAWARRSSCRGASTRRSANGTSAPSRAIRRASWTSTGACPPTTRGGTTTTSSPPIRSRASTSRSKDYQNGPLENWTTGALHFNGRDQYAVLANEDINRTVDHGWPEGHPQRTVSGADLKNPQIHTSNFLIEAYFKTAPGQKDATLIQKMDRPDTPCASTEAGGVTLAAQAVGAKASLASQAPSTTASGTTSSPRPTARRGPSRSIIDGKQDARGPGLGADASLANDADLYVGGTPQGHNLDGAIDFLRLARGTLADAKTTIEELYAWEFDGPFLYDFTGRKRPADGGEAGAIDERP